MTKCMTCNSGFKEFWTDQADGLAATVDEIGIYCADGSQFDGDEYIWNEKKPNEVEFGNICDNCIQSLKEQEKIIFERNFLFDYKYKEDNQDK